jgi:hypothetical protein
MRALSPAYASGVRTPRTWAAGARKVGKEREQIVQIAAMDIADELR